MLIPIVSPYIASAMALLSAARDTEIGISRPASRAANSGMAESAVPHAFIATAPSSPRAQSSAEAALKTRSEGGRAENCTGSVSASIESTVLHPSDGEHEDASPDEV